MTWFIPLHKFSDLFSQKFDVFDNLAPKSDPPDVGARLSKHQHSVKIHTV